MSQRDPAWSEFRAFHEATARGDRAAAIAASHGAAARLAADQAAARARIEELSHAGRFQDAAFLLRRLPKRWANETWVLQAGLALATQRRDQAAMLDHAARLRAAVPALPTGYLVACQSLRGAGALEQADAIATAGLAHCPTDAALLEEAAAIAEAAGEPGRAHRLWGRLRAADPASPRGWQGSVALSVLHRQDEMTGALLADGLARFPSDPTLLQVAARHAARAQLWAEAASCWQKLLATCPDDPALALAAASAMLGPGYNRDQRVADALRQLVDIQRRFPDYAPAYAAHLNALRDAGQLDQAQACGEAWRARFPDRPEIAIACARVAEDQGRPADAAALLAAAGRRAAPHPGLAAAFIRALSLAGQDTAAERAADAALADFPGNMGVIQQHVALATRRGDFAAAAARAAALAARFPGHAAIGGLVRHLAALRETAPDTPPPADAIARFYLRFESLGGTTGGACEFGFVQRQAGAEPLGLMRWARMRPDGLLAALANRFDGLGDPDTTRIDLHRASADYQEYYIHEDRYGYRSHTFIKADDAPADTVLRQSARRLAFLRRKLIEDLEAAEKIFVVKLPPEHVQAICAPLFAALRGYGETTLLCMTLADAGHPAGTVEMVEPGLFVGRGAMFSDFGLGEARGMDVEVWRRVCELVARRLI